MRKLNEFIWETHGIHAGTEQDHVKHGIDKLEDIIDKAIEANNPSITFIIHSPRLTNFRYTAEKDTNVKFIRGNRSYLNYPKRIANLRKKYAGKINIKFGVELEWMGPEIGLQWSRSKIFQAEDADYVIGSVHFAPEGLPYDGSKEEAQELLKLRGSLEAYWDGYFNEMIQMIESFGDMIQIIGHIDLPKLNVDMPEALVNFETSSHPLANKFRTLLELIADRNLSLDVNMAGKFKGVGVYPVQSILRRAHQLQIPVCVGTDTHHVRYYGLNYKESLEYIQEAGYESYVSYSKLIPENRTIYDDHELKVKYTVLNKGIELLNQRLDETERRIIPDFSFGGSFLEFVDLYKNSTGMGDYNAIRIRKWGKSITVTDEIPKMSGRKVNGLFSEHLDQPGVISSLFNTLASEGINVETARLRSNKNGTAEAFLSLSEDNGNVKSAIDFINGTDSGVFSKLIYQENAELPNYYSQGVYLLEMDGVALNLALSEKVILTKHRNSPGVLLILLSALASKNINIADLRLGKLNDIGYSAIAVKGDSNVIKNLLTRLGDQYFEANLIEFHSF
ncbi:histidinol-phosphatase HisJ family protein [Tamlana sp. 2_MG-2023]|uniref:histidinol-phosphatase HisJ family protein n=1 Tax=unclassified Tamlana TaxID=2614803 RepID=UPI0026E21FD2|nr:MULTISPECIES: histidinol-phosphatase HisJ family protein [unclassified Tamlana]MDO6759330.1 histidinol-phosphatase HisJ family protein [Tamlana sp. 2_MG-2023]MDO6790531.1 histidinol-phosphatase HisJ family protein [Tamlana sp. 1_MG-2023]